MPSPLNEERQIAQWLTEESIARNAWIAATNPDERDCHYMRAERYADRAWSLAETHDHPFIASTLWR